MNVLAKSIPWKAYQTTISKWREYQSLNKVFRAGLHLDAGAYYALCIVWVESNTAVSNWFRMCCCERWDFTSNTEHVIEIRRLLFSHIRCINRIVQRKVHRSVTNNFSVSEGPRVSIAITVQSEVHRSLTNNFSNDEAPRISSWHIHVLNPTPQLELVQNVLTWKVRFHMQHWTWW